MTTRAARTEAVGQRAPLAPPGACEVLRAPGRPLERGRELAALHHHAGRGEGPVKSSRQGDPSPDGDDPDLAMSPATLTLEPPAKHRPATSIPRRLACGDPGRQCETCREGRLHRICGHHGDDAAAALGILHDAVGSASHVLDTVTRVALEPRFGEAIRHVIRMIVLTNVSSRLRTVKLP